MQKDYMGMMQGQQPQPQEQMQGNLEIDQDIQSEMKKLGATSEQLENLGLPTGNDKESIKKRLLAIVDKLGLLQIYNTPKLQEQLARDVDMLAQAIADKDLEAIQKNPIVQQLAQSTQQQQAAPQQAAPQQAAPTDFASMMPPGGGMNGR